MTDRSAILRRRAFFVGSALTAALTGCPKEPEPIGPAPTQQKKEVRIPPVSSSASMPTGTGVAGTGSSAPGDKLPPLDVPAGASAAAKEQYEQLARDVPPIHQELDAADKELAGICDLTDPACDARWKAIADHLAKVEVAVDDLGPRCRGASADAKAYYERQAQHEAFIAARRAAIESRVAALASSKAAADAWRAHQSRAAIPRPCLDYSCNDW